MIKLFKKLDIGKPLYNLEVKLAKDLEEWKPMLQYWWPFKGTSIFVEMAEIAKRAEEYCGNFIVTNKDIMLMGYEKGLEVKVAELNPLEPGQIVASKDKFHKPLIDRNGEPTNFSSGIFGGPIYYPNIKIPVHAHFSDGKIISYIKEGKHFRITGAASQMHADYEKIAEKYAVKA